MRETMSRRQVLALAGGSLAAAGMLWPDKAVALPGRAGQGRPDRRSAFPFPLPPVGVEIPFSGYAANVPLQINTGVVNLDFKGGIRIRVETSDATGDKFSVIGFRMTATSPVLGTVTMKQADTTLTPLSVLQMSSTFPPAPEMLVYLDFTLSITNPPGGGGPLTVSTLEPAQLLATNITHFPPAHQAYNLQAPVPLGAPGTDPANAPVVLQGFPVILNHT